MQADLAARALLVLAGLAFGTSAFLFGFYDTTVWEPILLGCLALLLALAVARPAVPTGTSAIAVAGLVGLWLWSLLSSSWAEAADLAVTDANRWLLYAVMLVLLLSLLNGPADKRWLLGAATAGVLAVAAYVLVRLLLDQGPALFVGNRLNEPLNYINGNGAYLLVGLWPLVAVAERAKHLVLRGLSVFAAVQLISMAALTQSRGAVLALVVSAAVILIVVPDRLHRAWAMVAIAAGVAVSIPALVDVINAGGPNLTTPSSETLRGAAEASLAGGVAAGGLWTLASFVARALSRRSEATNRSLRWLSIAGISLIAVVAAAVAIFPPGQRIDQARGQYRAFTALRPADPSTRLASGGGNRYDYWRIALNQFESHPLDGVGAGNFDRTYYLQRRTSENIQQAHSIELQTLGELGVVGALALAAFLGAVLFGFWRTARGTASGLADPAIAVAAGGTFLVWLVHTSVDWLHLIPGLTGIGICAAAVLLPPARPRPARTPVIAIVIAVIVVGAAAYPVVRQTLALRLQSQGHDKLLSDPVGALKDAQDSLSLEPAQQTYYLESAAYARLGLYRPARDALLTAARNQPHDFVSWGLLGDLATRRGLTAVAHRDYRRASMLNPLDPGLATLARGREKQR